jgi:hypothetical protein
VVPSSVPFSFTIEQPDVQVSWAGASGGSLALGSVTRGDLAAFEGPTLTIKGKTGAEAPVTFQADHPHVGLRPTAGATVMGGGTVGAGTYKVVLAPETPAGTYQGTLRLSSMSNKVRLNGQVEPLAYTYDLTVTDPVTATLKLVGAGLGTLALVAGGFIAWRMVPRGKGGKKKGTRINLEGALELIRPAQRIEKLEKLERHKVTVGKGGDLFAEADARFELSAWMHDGQPTIVLRKHRPSR